MATTPKLKREPRTGIYYIHWTDHVAKGKPGRSKRQTTGTDELVKAQQYLGHYLLFDSTKSIVAVATVAELWSLYFEKHVQRNNISDDTAEKCWRQLKLHFGSLKVSDVSQDSVDAYEDKRRRGTIGRGATSATVRKETTFLRACFNWCADPKRKILKRDEVPVFDLPAGGEPNDRWLRTEEVEALKKAAAEDSHRLRNYTGGRMCRGERFLAIGLETAARSEAIRQLTWDRVDWQTKTIDFNVPGRQRTKKRRTVVPISKTLDPVLLRMHKERVNEYVLDNDMPVFKAVKKIAENAGLLDVSPHVLRHTAATHMARRGVPLYIVAKVLADTIATVERIYAKHAPEDLRVAVDTISGDVMGVGK